MATIATYTDIAETCEFLAQRVDINTSLGACITLLYRTGLRINEACELKRFTLGVDTFTVDTEKKSYNRTFSLSLLPSAYLPLLPYLPAPLTAGTFSSASSVTRYVLSNSPKVFYKAEKNITTNIFRYHYARKLQHEGLTIEQIQAQMGHLNVSSTLSYLSEIYYL